MSAGKTMPPMAAAKGTAAVLKSESEPISSSRFISKPTNKKKKLINTSLMNASVVNCSVLI